MPLTRFERARVIGARALQISMGAPVLIKTKSTDAAEIAMQELEANVLPLTIIRRMPDGHEILLNVKGEIIGKTKK